MEYGTRWLHRNWRPSDYGLRRRSWPSSARSVPERRNGGYRGVRDGPDGGRLVNDEPARILLATRTLYASLSHYQDAGRLKVTGNEPLTLVSEIFFRTAFRRPNRFRFEYKYRYHPTTPWRRFVICANDSCVQ